MLISSIIKFSKKAYKKNGRAFDNYYFLTLKILELNLLENFQSQEKLSNFSRKKSRFKIQCLLYRRLLN